MLQLLYERLVITGELVEQIDKKPQYLGQAVGPIDQALRSTDGSVQINKTRSERAIDCSIRCPAFVDPSRV